MSISARALLSNPLFSLVAFVSFHLAKYHLTEFKVELSQPTHIPLLSVCGATPSKVLELSIALEICFVLCSSLGHNQLPVISSYEDWMFKGFENSKCTCPFTVKLFEIFILTVFMLLHPVHFSTQCNMASVPKRLLRLFSLRSWITASVLNVVGISQLST